MNTKWLIYAMGLTLMGCTTKGIESVTNSETSEQPVLKHRTIASPDWIEGNFCHDERSVFRSNGTAERRITYEKCGEVLESELFHPGPEGRIASSSLFTRIENVEYVWRYDSTGRLTEKKALLPTSYFPMRITYNYDSTGYLISEMGVLTDDIPARYGCRIEYQYNDAKLTRTVFYGGAECDQVTRKIEHFYGEDGSEVRRHYYESGEEEKFIVRGVFHAFE